MPEENQQHRVCLVLGEQSLLIQCCELLLSRQYEIGLVVTLNPLVMEWCEKHAVQYASHHKLAVAALQGQPVDYLFSITNLNILPAELLALPAQHAVNFHDGPLPHYGGLNAPVWSLLNGETQHGVSWHLMTSDIDCGDLLAQRLFPVASADTAFSLNAKCFQAAIESFTDLLDNFDSPAITKTAHTLSRDSYHGLTDRPAAAATLCWSQSAVEMDRLIRGLDFGRFPNPLILPQLNLGVTRLLVRGCEIDGKRTGDTPGTILSNDDNALRVATVDGTVTFTRLSDLAGKNVVLSDVLTQCDLTPGDTLPVLDEAHKQALTDMVSRICKHESFWKDQLLHSEPLEAPYIECRSTLPSEWQHRNFPLVPQGLSSDTVIAVFVLLLARLDTRSGYSLAVRTLVSEQYESPVKSYFSQLVPLCINYEADWDFDAWRNTVSLRIRQLEQRIGFLSDLWAREPALADVVACTDYPIRLERVQTLDDVQTMPPSGHTQLTVVVPENPDQIRVYHDAQSMDNHCVTRLLEQFAVLLDAVVANSSMALKHYPLIPDSERQLLKRWNSSTAVYDKTTCVHQLVERHASEHPDTMAYRFADQQLSYHQLNARANQLARHLLVNNVQSGDLVGVLLDRSLEMVIALLATLKAGCAYVPMDPAYPDDRLTYMADDSGIKTVVTQRRHAQREVCAGITLVLPQDLPQRLNATDASDLNLACKPASLAYVIYTSGSTGKPKGVMVEHRNVVNFFAGMDERVEPGPGTWLALTSMSFDISVLEIFWTLSRGFTVVLHADSRPGETTVPDMAGTTGKSIDFGLFYWNVATDDSQYDTDKYKLLLDSARFADTHGFSSVWTPERHFASFGGLFPNPSVTSAALATITDRISIRAGSCVVPLHSPIRIAEEWAVVDNLSNGRVGIAIAAGWAAPDFAIMPENFAESKKIMYESAETVKRLWRGETVDFPGANGKATSVRTLPRPLQADLPLWITTAGNIDNFHSAGKLGANLLTHLLGQTIEEVAEKVAAYRQAWREAGHEGAGTVTVMVHTFVGHDEQQVEDVVRQPLKNYLKSAMFLVKESAWQFPTFKKMSEDQGKTLDEFFETISDDDMDALLEFAFQRYFHTSGLFGTPQSCMGMVNKIHAADVDEIACLIDYGIKDDIVLAHLPQLNKLRETAANAVVQAKSIETPEQENHTLPELMQRFAISHLQCTPSMATLLASDQQAHAGLANLTHMMVGGEAFPPTLADSLTSLVGGRVTNMYGPTETTIWSSTGDVEKGHRQNVPIGRPLPNQQLYVLDAHQQQLPIGVIGELFIAGDGVVRGYHGRQDLTDQAFMADPFSQGSDARMYRTGDLARYLPDGQIECLGRVDQQVKIRGYRVELGEIEAVLRQNAQILESVVILREDVPGDKRLVAYFTRTSGDELDFDSLKKFLRDQLPEFMVPSVYIPLRQLPLTPNGKVDRKGLPMPQAANDATNEAAGPDNDTEKMLVAIWAKALNVDSVGVRDNFFDIGGHSLLIIQVLNELVDKVSKPVKLTDLFKYTTIESLAAFLDVKSETSAQMSAGQARVAARKASMGRRRRKS